MPLPSVLEGSGWQVKRAASPHLLPEMATSLCVVPPPTTVPDSVQWDKSGTGFDNTMLNGQAPLLQIPTSSGIGSGRGRPLLLFVPAATPPSATIDLRQAKPGPARG